MARTWMVVGMGAPAWRVSFREKQPPPNRLAVDYLFVVQSRHRGESSPVRVRFSSEAVDYVTPEAWGLKPEKEDVLVSLGLCRIGDYLDSLKGKRSSPPADVLEAQRYYLQQLENREPAADAQILNYMGVKSCAAVRFRERIVEFHGFDSLRLGLGGSTEDFSHLARGFPGWWQEVSGTAPWFEPTPELTQQCHRGTAPGLVSQPTYQIQELLSEARYSATSEYFENAVRFLEDGDSANAVEEAAAALQAMTRLVVEDTSASMSTAVGILKAESVPPALAAIIAKAWGYASNKARHGNVDGPAVDGREAEFFLNLVASSLMYLREVDSS